MTDASFPAPARPVALVTGASRGLGFSIAAALGAKGYHVIAVARTTGGLEELDDLIQKSGGSATLAPLNVTDENAMAHLAKSILERWACAFSSPTTTASTHRGWRF
jgi:NAD(P)-dependent dehydrogenase (short-subunit alcohol dehydrogenase family)